jgi:hypothetical protein
LHGTPKAAPVIARHPPAHRSATTSRDPSPTPSYRQWAARHNGTWLNAGIYDQPVPSERSVHDLERGAVWITYDPGLPATEVQTLRGFVLRQATLPETTQSGPSTSRYLVMSPWAGSLPSPIVLSS